MESVTQPGRVVWLIETEGPIRPGEVVPTRLEVSVGRRFVDRIEFPEDSPPHHLRIAGYAVKRSPKDSTHLRRPCLNIPVGRGQLVVALAAAEVTLENGSAIAAAEWGERGLVSCAIRLEPHRWDGDDAGAALRALRWLERLSGRTFRGGGSPKGWRKGRVWDRQDYLDWYRVAGQSYAMDGERLTLRHLGEAMGVSEDTAHDRLRDVGLPWPPETDRKAWDPDPDEWDPDD